MIEELRHYNLLLAPAPVHLRLMTIIFKISSKLKYLKGDKARDCDMQAEGHQAMLVAPSFFLSFVWLILKFLSNQKSLKDDGVQPIKSSGFG